MNPVEPKTGDEVTVGFHWPKRECRACILVCKWWRKEMQDASKTERFDFYGAAFLWGQR